MSLNTIPGIGGDGSVTATTTPQKIANSLSVQRVVTISSLKGVAGTVDGETVLAEGYDVRGDCEPLSYYWDADSVLADDGVDSTHPGLVVQPTSVSGAGRWVARRPSYINVKWYGAKGDNVQDDRTYIQQAANRSILNDDLPKHVFFPGGIYSISGGILFKKDSNGDKQPEFFSMKVSGEAGLPYGGVTNSMSRLNCTHSDTFALAFQSAKGLDVEYMELSGTNNPSFATAYAAYTDAESGYVTGSCRDNGLSPYAGIVIDPFGPSSISAGNRYPGYSDEYISGHTTGGSTDINIRRTTINGFTCNVAISPNGSTQNAEIITFRQCKFGRAKVYIAVCQSQSRSVNIEHCSSSGPCLRYVDCSTYGAGGGPLPNFYGGTIGGTLKYLLYLTSTTQSAAKIEKLFAESLYSLGIANTRLLTFDGCSIKLNLPSSTNAASHCLLSSTQIVDFNNCFINHSANAPSTRPVQFNVQQLRFTNTDLDAPPSNIDQYELVLHTNSTFRHLNPARSSRGNQYSNGGLLIADPFTNFNGLPMASGQAIIIRGSNWTKRIVNIGPAMRIETIESAVTLTVGTDGTGTFTSTVPERWSLAGSTPCMVLIYTNVANEFSVNNYVAAYVSSVVSSTVTLSGLPPQITTGSHTVRMRALYRWHEPCIGTTTSGSAVITNVRCSTSLSTVWSPGELISGSTLFAGTHVVSRNAAAFTITLNQNASSSATGIDLYDALVQTISVASAQPTTGGWTKGDVIDDSTGATNGWRCTASGTFGSGTDPTFATR